MDNPDKEVQVFRAIRSLVALQKHFFVLLNNLKAQHDINVDRVGESLVDMEEFIKDKYNVDIDLAHLVRHFQFLDENQYSLSRKAILDYSNALQRDLQK